MFNRRSFIGTAIASVVGLFVKPKPEEIVAGFNWWGHATCDIGPTQWITSLPYKEELIWDYDFSYMGEKRELPPDEYNWSWIVYEHAVVILVGESEADLRQLAGVYKDKEGTIWLYRGFRKDELANVDVTQVQLYADRAEEDINKLPGGIIA